MSLSRLCGFVALLLIFSFNPVIAQQSGCNVGIAENIVQNTYGGRVVSSYYDPNNWRYIVTLQFRDGRTGVYYLDQNCRFL